MVKKNKEWDCLKNQKDRQTPHLKCYVRVYICFDQKQMIVKIGFYYIIDPEGEQFKTTTSLNFKMSYTVMMSASQILNHVVSLLELLIDVNPHFALSKLETCNYWKLSPYEERSGRQTL